MDYRLGRLQPCVVEHGEQGSTEGCQFVGGVSCWGGGLSGLSTPGHHQHAHQLKSCSLPPTIAVPASRSPAP